MYPYNMWAFLSYFHCDMKSMCSCLKTHVLLNSLHRYSLFVCCYVAKYWDKMSTFKNHLKTHLFLISYS